MSEEADYREPGDSERHWTLMDATGWVSLAVLAIIPLIGLVFILGLIGVCSGLI
jgi:hypothetical protein